jgi:ATP-binding cassette, subfamily B, bacterial
MIVFALIGAVLAVASLGAGVAARSRLSGHRAGRERAEMTTSLPRRWRSAGWLLLKPDRALAGLVIWLMILDTVLALAAPWPLKIVIDYGLGQRPLPPWLTGLRGTSHLRVTVLAAAAGLALVILGSVAGYLVTVLVGAVGERMMSRLQVGMVSHLLRSAPRAVARYPAGELASRLSSDAGRVADTVTTAIETLVPDLAVLAGMTLITALLDWRLTLIVLGVVPLYALTARVRNKSLRRPEQQARTRAGSLAAHAAELLGRIPAVHVFDRADDEVRCYSRASLSAADASVGALDARARFSPITDSLPGLGLAAALISGCVEVSAGRLSTGGLLVFLAYLSSLTGPIRSLAQLSTAITRGSVSRDRIAELIALPPARPADGSTRHSLRSGPEFGPAGSGRTASDRNRRGVPVTLREVQYSHRPGHLVLRSVNLQVTAGEFVCITGPSGAGKSTLLSLLIGLSAPDAGLIAIDGQEIASLSRARLSRLVSLVPQDPWLSSGSIAESIRYGNAAAGRLQIEEAARVAGVSDFTRDLPGGLDTEIGEQGRLLSGGQQRRVAVARALLADTPVLLLDEPTSGLDARSEELLVSRLLASAGGKTLILVTHATRLAALADRVMRLDQGRLRHDDCGGQTVAMLAGGSTAPGAEGKKRPVPSDS